MTATDLEPNPGRRYHLLERIGSGAFGDVYLAELESGGFKRRVALKVLNEASAQRRHARQRIREEAKILGRLAHRHIVAALDFVRIGKGYAIVMDYVQGADLDHVLTALEVARESLPMRAAFEVAGAVADALHAAYTAVADDGRPLGIVHRDIKPSNLRLTPDGEVKVLDFGIAFAGSRPEAPGNPIVGTEVYMAPERFLGVGDDPSSDVYSLGVTLLELLIGHTLGPTPTHRDVHYERVSVAVAHVERFLQGGPPALIAEILDLLSRCLSYDASHRPTADVLVERFESIAAQIPGEGLRPFCRRFVPTVANRVGAQPEPVTGVWTEEVATGFRPMPGGTLVPEDAPPQVERTQAPRQTGGGWVRVAVAAALLACAGGGVALAYWFRAPPVEGEASAQVAPNPVPAPVPVRVSVSDPVPDPVGDPGARPAPAIAGPSETVAEVPPRRGGAVVRESAPPVPTEVRTVEKAQFSVRDASKLEVACGDRSAIGTSSVRLTSFPAGSCRLTAEHVGRTVTGVFTVDRVGQVQCEVAEGRLLCSTP